MTGISNPYRYSNEAILGFKCCFSDPAPLEFTIKTNPPMRSYSFSFIFILLIRADFIYGRNCKLGHGVATLASLRAMRLYPTPM